MTREKISALIRALRDLTERPATYLGNSNDVTALQLWLFGMLASCQALGYRYSISLEVEIFASHGLERNSDGVLGQLRASGLSEESIVYLLIDLEIEKWMRASSELSD